MQQLQTTSILISTIWKDQSQQIHKVQENGQYRVYIYTPFSKQLYLFHDYAFYLRENHILKKKDINPFKSKVEHQVIKDNQEKEQIQTYILTKSSFMQPTNLFKQLNMPHFKGQKRLSMAKLISDTIIVLVLTLMVITNYQLYAWADLTIKLEEQRQNVSIQINEAATTGMSFLMFGEPITFGQFAKIYEILQPECFEKKHWHQKFSFQMKIRSIAKILLNLIIKKHFQLLKSLPEYTDTPDNKILAIQECQAILQKRKDLFKKLLQHKQIISSIRAIQEETKVNYYRFLWEILVEEKQMQWSQVIDLIVPKKDTPSKFKIRNGVSFTKIVKQYQKSLILQQQKEYKDNLFQAEQEPKEFYSIFKNLGLDKDPRVFLIAMLSLQSSYAKEAICYSDLDALFQDQSKLDFQIRDQLFSFYSKVGAKGLCLKQLQKEDQEDSCQQMKQQSRCQSNQNFIQDSAKIVVSPIKSQFIQKENRRNSQSKFQQNIQSLQKDITPLSFEQQSSQLGSYLNALSQNYGTFAMKIKKSNFITQNYYSSGFSKYNSLFK